MNQDDIQQIFLQECDEGLSSAEIGLIACRATAPVTSAARPPFCFCRVLH